MLVDKHTTCPFIFYWHSVNQSHICLLNTKDQMRKQNIKFQSLIYDPAGVWTHFWGRHSTTKSPRMSIKEDLYRKIKIFGILAKNVHHKYSMTTIPSQEFNQKYNIHRNQLWLVYVVHLVPSKQSKVQQNLHLSYNSNQAVLVTIPIEIGKKKFSKEPTLRSTLYENHLSNKQLFLNLNIVWFHLNHQVNGHLFKQTSILPHSVGLYCLHSTYITSYTDLILGPFWHVYVAFLKFLYMCIFLLKYITCIQFCSMIITIYDICMFHVSKKLEIQYYQSYDFNARHASNDHHH